LEWTEFRLWYGEKIDIRKLYNACMQCECVWVGIGIGIGSGANSGAEAVV